MRFELLLITITIYLLYSSKNKTRYPHKYLSIAMEYSHSRCVWVCGAGFFKIRKIKVMTKTKIVNYWSEVKQSRKQQSIKKVF